MENVDKGNYESVVGKDMLGGIVGDLLKVIRGLNTKQDLGFFRRLKLAFSKDVCFLKITDKSNFLMNVDKLELELKDLNKAIKDTIAMKDESFQLVSSSRDEALVEVQNKKSEILNYKADINSLKLDIENKLDSIKKLQDEINTQSTLIEIKTESLNEKSTLLAASMSSNNKLVTRLAEAKKSIKNLTDELSDLTANFNNKVTQAVRDRCKAGGDEILKAYKKAHPKEHKDDHIPSNVGDDVVKSEPVVTPELPTLEDSKTEVEFNMNKRAVPVEKVIGMRKLLTEGKRKFEIQKIYPELSKSTVLRICNNESYTEDIYQYHPEVAVSVEAESTSVNVNAVSDVVNTIDECAFKHKTVKRKRVKGEKR